MAKTEFHIIKQDRHFDEKYYEVKRILKAYFDAQTIADFKEKLLSYQQLIGQKDNDKNAGS